MLTIEYYDVWNITQKRWAKYWDDRGTFLLSLEEAQLWFSRTQWDEKDQLEVRLLPSQEYQSRREQLEQGRKEWAIRIDKLEDFFRRNKYADQYL